MAFETEYAFTLPRGFVDEAGVLHKEGIMRLATAADEILPMRDPRVQQNPSYLTVILLARVVIKLGDLKAIDTKIIEKLFTADLAYLQDMYQRINQMDEPGYSVSCPHCGQGFVLPVNFMEAVE